MTIKWDPTGGLLTDDGDVISPATILENEVDHAIAQSEDYTGLRERQGIEDENFKNLEEKRVILGTETKQAKANGEISPSKTQSRSSHSAGKNKRVEVKDSTSTEIVKEYE